MEQRFVVTMNGYEQPKDTDSAYRTGVAVLTLRPDEKNILS